MNKKYIKQLKKGSKIILIVILAINFLISSILTILTKSVKVGIFVFVFTFLYWVRALYFELKYHSKKIENWF